MAQAILLRGGTGGVTSDDVTASKAQVLQGYKTVTTDSNDEIVEGTIIQREHAMSAAGFEKDASESRYLVRLEEGYYPKRGSWKPCVTIPYAVLANVAGIDASKMLNNLTVAGVTGKIKMINTQDNDYNINKSTAFGIDHIGRFWVDFPHGNGYYFRGDNHPHTCIDADKLGNATADKVVAGSSFTSKNGVNVQGQIPDRGDGQVVSYLQGREDWANRIWVLFKNGWYHRTPWDDGQGHIHEAYVYVTYEQIKNLFGIDASKMLQGYSVAGVQGAIPWWVCTTGDVITALGGEGFAWDDTTGANRGRGIVTRIPNGHFIQGANYAFLPSPNLYPWNIREGVNIHGIVGTMKDSNAGRVAFRNATFDNVLVSGVANIGLGNSPNVYSKPSTEIRDGIIRFSNTSSVSGGGLHQYRSNTVLEEAVTLAHSVNLSSFRTIRLGLKYPYGGRWATIGGVGSLVGVLWALPTTITPDYVASRNSKTNPNVIKRVGYKDGVIPMAQGRWNTPTEIPVGAEYFVDIDVSDLQGHHRIVLGMAVSEAGHRENITIQVSVYVNNSVSGISHIEFIN